MVFLMVLVLETSPTMKLLETEILAKDATSVSSKDEMIEQVTERPIVILMVEMTDQSKERVTEQHWDPYLVTSME